MEKKKSITAVPERFKDILGKHLGKLTVLEIDHVDFKYYKCYYKCQCDCGNIVVKRRQSLMAGDGLQCDDCRTKDTIEKSASRYIGKRFGKLVVEELDHVDIKNRIYYFKCKCDCGNTTIKKQNALINSINLQCEECYKKSRTEKAANEYIGKRFGKLTVVKLDHIEEKEDKYKKYRAFIYECKCDCGNTTLVDKYSLQRGNVKSCGCLAIGNNTTHGMSGTRFYKIWNSMINRCHNSNTFGYEYYGGRGIIVCDRWRYNFENFRDDMYDSYCEHVAEYGEVDTSIDRINSNGNYEPGNCRWATKTEQSRNTSRNIRLKYHDREYIAIELANLFCPHITDRTFYDRLEKNGYKNGDTIDESTCYDTIFKGTHIQQAIRFIDKDEKDNNEE